MYTNIDTNNWSHVNQAIATGMLYPKINQCDHYFCLGCNYFSVETMRLTKLISVYNYTVHKLNWVLQGASS